MANRRNKLNAKQIHLLRIIYKFRFVTSDLVAQFKKVSRTSVNYSLTVLRDQGLVDRKYDSKYKLQGKGAIYYLTAKGVRALKDDALKGDGFRVSDNVIKSIYKNKLVTDEFVELCLAIMEVFIALRRIYAKEFLVFSRSELAVFNYFPTPSPSLYICRSNKRSTTKQFDYMLDVIADTRLFVYKQRIQAYADHAYEVDWPVNDGKYPILLIVVPNNKVEKTVNRYIDTLLEDFDIYTTTMDRLLNSDDKKVWFSILDQEDDEPVVYREL